MQIRCIEGVVSGVVERNIVLIFDLLVALLKHMLIILKDLVELFLLSAREIFPVLSPAAHLVHLLSVGLIEALIVEILVLIKDDIGCCALSLFNFEADLRVEPRGLARVGKLMTQRGSGQQFSSRC